MINDSTKLGDVTWGEFRAALDEMGYQIVRKPKTEGQDVYKAKRHGLDTKDELKEIIERHVTDLFTTHQVDGRVRRKFKNLGLQKYMIDLVDYIKENEFVIGNGPTVVERGIMFQDERIDGQTINRIFRELYGDAVILKKKDHTEIVWNTIFTVLTNREEDKVASTRTTTLSNGDSSSLATIQEPSTTTTTTSEG